MPPNTSPCAGILLATPETWRTALLRKHLSSHCRAALAQTCKAALSWLLADWPNPALRVSVRATDESEDLLRRMVAARRQFVKRGDQLTTLLLEQHGQIRDRKWWHIFFASLVGLSANLELVLQLWDISEDMLSFAAKAIPGLHSLTLGSSTDSRGISAVQLPPPSALPALRHLTIHTVAADSQTALWLSVQPYMAQLHSLTIGEQQGEPAVEEGDVDQDQPAWLGVFTGTSHSLKQVTLPVELTPQLTDLLLLHAPAVEKLTVSGIRHVDSGAVEPQCRVCSWRTLHVANGEFPENTWEWLPVPAEGKLVVDTAELTFTQLPLNYQTSQTLARVQFEELSLIRIVAMEIDVESQATAVRSAVTHLEQLNPPTLNLVLEDFTMTAELAAVLATVKAQGWHRLSLSCLHWPADTPPIPTPLPALGYLDIVRQLDDALLKQLMQCVTTVTLRLRVPEVSLQSPLPEGTSLPWHTLAVQDSMSVHAWLQQAAMLGPHIAWECMDLYVDLSKSQIKSDVHRDMANQLGRVHLVRVTEFTVMMNESVIAGLEPRALRASLAVLAHLPCTPDHVSFRYWRASSAVISEFKALLTMPSLRGAELLDFSVSLHSGSSDPDEFGCWPLMRLPLCIPRGFRTWTIHASYLDSQELQAFMTCAPADRTREHPLTIRVSGRTDEWIDRLARHLQRIGSCPYVSVVSTARLPE